LSSKSDMDGVLSYMEQMDIVTKVKSCYRVEGGDQK
jgi:homoserine dehydrogenase